MIEPLIKCEHVDFGYENQDAVVDVNMEVCPGDYLCIVGENGSGKSTLMKGLLGLLKPSAGVLTVSEELKHTGIGYLPQQTRAQKDFPATVSEVVLSGFLSARGWKFFYTPAQKSQALQHMGKLGILELKDKMARESAATGLDFSGGAKNKSAATPDIVSRLVRRIDDNGDPVTVWEFVGDGNSPVKSRYEKYGIVGAIEGYSLAWIYEEIRAGREAEQAARKAEDDDDE